ncbi:MAG: hypothetical protein OSA99_13040 [Acidimicrobiales bacterium]|nr:hypothetical protein [Acidimicrobiales bacterium]
MAPQSPASPLIDASDLVVMVARPVVDQLHSAAAQLVALRDRGVRAGWCLSGDGAYDSTAVESAYGIPVLGTLPSDARGASLLFSAAATRRLTRTPLVRAASSLANHLATWLTDREGEDVAHVASGRPADEAVVDSGSAGARA